MKVTIIKKNNCNIFLNSLGIQLFGSQSAKGVEISTEAHKAEIKELENSGLIEVVEEDQEKKVEEKKSEEKKVGRPKGSENKKKKVGRPKGSKNKKKEVSQNSDKKEDDSEKSVVNIGGSSKKVNSIKSNKNPDESHLDIDASLEAAEKIDEEERKISKQEEEEANSEENQEAVVATGNRSFKKVTPQKNETNSAFIDSPDDSDDLPNEFIEI